ncbi:MAG TPA: hypothetical protein VJS44_23245 [Pyrinomonadaceae bacterium]|nr:hypothetical protein [Pyrinomonadaceae bacterium]
MKNRRLNVLFIAIIALAAAPQAMHDAHRLVNAAQERAESEFWSIFLSYTSPEAGEAKSSGKSELMAARGREEMEICPTERVVVRQSVAPRSSQPVETRARAKAEARRMPAEEKPEPSEAVDIASEEVASVYEVRPVAFSEKEQEALKAAQLHARDVEKFAAAASRASVAAFAPGSEPQMKMKLMGDVDKLLRQRTRNIKDRSEFTYEIQTPNTVGSM